MTWTLTWSLFQDFKRVKEKQWMFSPYQKIAFDQRLRCYVDQKTIGMLKVTNTKMYHSGSQFLWSPCFTQNIARKLSGKVVHTEKVHNYCYGCNFENKGVIFVLQFVMKELGWPFALPLPIVDLDQLVYAVTWTIWSGPVYCFGWDNKEISQCRKLFIRNGIA